MKNKQVPIKGITTVEICGKGTQIWFTNYMTEKYSLLRPFGPITRNSLLIHILAISAIIYSLFIPTKESQHGEEKK